MPNSTLNLSKTVALYLGVLVMSFLVGYLVFAWTEPTASPPGQNVDTPINVGSTGQLKTGALTISGGFESTGATLLATQGGSVGIGTTGPDAKLDVLSTGTQLRLTYADGSVYSDLAVNSSGNLTITPSGTRISLASGKGLVLGSNTSDLAGVNGMMYYNSSTNTFRCYQNGGWTNCGGGGGLPTGSEGQMLYNNAGTWTAFSGMYWDDTNNRLGIGTVSPGAKLDISNIATTTGLKITTNYAGGAVVNYGVQASTSGSTSQNYGGSFSATGGPYAFGLLAQASSGSNANYGLYSIATGTSGTKFGVYGRADSSGPNYALYGYASGGNPNWGLYVETGNGYISGNLGLGTTNPRGKLDIAPSTSEGDIWGIDRIIGYNDLRFYADNLGSTERMRLTNSGGLVIGSGYMATDPGAGNVIIQGNVGIGTPSPGAKLDVNGNLNVGGKIYGWNVPSDVKYTSATHNGNFGGYNGMHNWIQANGCSGYHVCTAEEIMRYLTVNGNDAEGTTGWGWILGEQSPMCNGWTASSLSGRAWNAAGNYIQDLDCGNAYAVFCCK
jgi:hypothetical protein